MGAPSPRGAVASTSRRSRATSARSGRLRPGPRCCTWTSSSTTSWPPSAGRWGRERPGSTSSPMPSTASSSRTWPATRSVSPWSTSWAEQSRHPPEALRSYRCAERHVVNPPARGLARCQGHGMSLLITPLPASLAAAATRTWTDDEGGAPLRCCLRDSTPTGASRGSSRRCCSGRPPRPAPAGPRWAPRRRRWPPEAELPAAQDLPLLRRPGLSPACAAAPRA